MEPNTLTVEINGEKQPFRVIPYLRTNRKWAFQIEDYAVRLVIEQDENLRWVQSSGQDKLNDALIQKIGEQIKKQYL